MGTVPAPAFSGEAQILVVEDDPDSAATLIDILETEGYRVAWVPQGQAALDYLHASPAPCVILLDLVMPVMDGAEFRRRQLQEPALAAIPVVVMTGASDSPEQAFAIAAMGYFVKPYDINELLDIIARCCRAGEPDAPGLSEPEEKEEAPGEIRGDR